MQAFLDGLTAVHSGEATYRLHYGDQAPQDRSRFGIKGDTLYPEAVHPVVRGHPETGRKSLFANRGAPARSLSWGTPRARPCWSFSTATRRRRSFRCASTGPPTR
jgi:taurine dioxygenase